MTVIGALSSFRELGEMSPHKRAAVQEIEGMVMLFVAANGGRSSSTLAGFSAQRWSRKGPDAPYSPH
jgi:hypothetical protein